MEVLRGGAGGGVGVGGGVLISGGGMGAEDEVEVEGLCTREVEVEGLYIGEVG